MGGGNLEGRNLKERRDEIGEVGKGFNDM
ncbi:HAMP domain-containing protein [Bacillus pumilus]